MDRHVVELSTRRARQSHDAFTLVVVLKPAFEILSFFDLNRLKFRAQPDDGVNEALLPKWAIHVEKRLNKLRRNSPAASPIVEQKRRGFNLVPSSLEVIGNVRILAPNLRQDLVSPLLRPRPRKSVDQLSGHHSLRPRFPSSLAPLRES